MRENYLKVRWKQTRKREKTIGESIPYAYVCKCVRMITHYFIMS